MGLCSKHREQCHHKEISQYITMADAAEEAKQKEALNGQLKEYIAEWRKTREKEEGNQSRAGEEAQPSKEGRGGETQTRRERKEGQGSWSRQEEVCCWWSRWRCPQRNDKDQGTA